VNTFLSFGYELLICDADMIFFQARSIWYTYLGDEKLFLQVVRNKQNENRLLSQRWEGFSFKGTLVSNLHLHHCNRIHCPILSGINLLMSWLPVMRWWTQWMMTDWKSGIAVSMPSSAIKIACSLIVLWFRFFKLFCALTLNASPNSASLEFDPNQGL
jgi:hypothetical protein